MIFLSHNTKDKPVVEQVALRLRKIYGQDNVFYDSWSIQPGDGIIDKIGQGLGNCKYFFFFVSKNSLQSNMVKLEWQNALFKAAQNAIRFIPIRMDKSSMPSTLMQSLYIDFLENGLDIAVRQIVDVINGTNTYRQENDNFSNLVAYKYWNGDELIIECRAQYLEPRSDFLFCTQYDTDNINANLQNENLCNMGSEKDHRLISGYTTNVMQISIEKVTHPDFPFVVVFTSKDKTHFDIEIVMHKKSHKEYRTIPLVEGRHSE